MTKTNMVEYLQNELKYRFIEYNTIKTEYEKANHMDRIGMAFRLEKVQDIYYHLWMICNDLGIVNPTCNY